MNTDPRLDILGAALADQSRSRMLCELMDGRAFTNKELAAAASISPQTASAQLRHLEAVGLTLSLRSGRFTYHRIASAEVAQVLETLASLSPVDHMSRGHRHAAAPRFARRCYNHLAGHLGVLIAERLIAQNVLTLKDETIAPGPQYRAFLRDLDLAEPPNTAGKPALKLCLDWTERRYHLLGPVATALLEKCLQQAWLTPHPTSRALTITEAGQSAFQRWFGFTPEDFQL